MFVFNSVYVVCQCGLYAYECSCLLRSGGGSGPPDPGVIAIFQLSAFSARNCTWVLCKKDAFSAAEPLLCVPPCSVGILMIICNSLHPSKDCTEFSDVLGSMGILVCALMLSCI